MSELAWIVCENSNGWAASVRITMARHTRPAHEDGPIVETRTLAELGQRLDARQRACVLIEVRRANLADILAWLSNATAKYTKACFVGLIGNEQYANQELDEVTAALRAAGVTEVSLSPRELLEVVKLGRRHEARQALEAKRSHERLPLAEWAWTLLPWQET